MKINDKTLPKLALIFSIVFVIAVLLLSTGITGDTDSITHYLFARYAFKYPGHFLDHWAKPLFTILSSPFAQLGLYGAIAFNLASGLLAAWLVYKIASKLLYDYAWVVIPMVIFTPVYLINMYTSLTEVLFSLVVVGAIYLFLYERYVLAAIVISFIPFARTEGLMFLPLFFVAFLWLRKYKAIPFLVTGFVLFGLLGMPKYGDFWWFFTGMPYGEAGSAKYGSGSFFHYFANFYRIMGIPLIILALIGSMAMFKWFISEKKLYRDVGWATEYLLILPGFFGFILAHSFLWWQGLMGVLASDRFMACVMPLGALIALAGFNVIINNLSYNRVTRNRIGTLIMISILVTPFIYYKIPFIPRGSYYTIEAASKWLKQTPYKDKFIYYFDPSVAYFMGLDPWSKSNSLEFAPNLDHPEKTFKDNSIIFWENNFAAFEAKLSFDKLLYNPHFRLLNVFSPRKDFKSAVVEYYLLAIFEKIEKDTTERDFLFFKRYDFEQDVPADRTKYLTRDQYTSGQYAYRVQPDNFSAGLEMPVEELPGGETVLMRLSGKFNLPEGYPQSKMILVLEIRDDRGKMYRYLVAKNDNPVVPGQWFEVSMTTAVNKRATAGGNIKLYAWNRAEMEGLVDDLEIEFFPIQEYSEK